jgi:outer membrane protein TolC
MAIACEWRVRSEILRTILLGLLIVLGNDLGRAQEPVPGLSLAEAERLAVANEPGFTAQLVRAQAFREQAVADRQLPDPALVVGALNVPTNNFSLKSEPMTQLRLGLRQKFPRGDSRRIRQGIALATADEMVSNAATRHLWVKREVRFAWFDVAYWEAARKIVDADRPLFVQLRDVTASLYEVGRKDLQDVVRSELELQRLEDRLTLIRERIENSRAELSRWVGLEAAYRPVGNNEAEWVLHLAKNHNSEDFVSDLIEHPLIAAMDDRVRQQNQRVELARQNYKPNWAIDLAYGDRRAVLTDRSVASDVWSAWLTVDLPLFRGKRQDRTLEASRRHYQAAMNDRLEKLRALLSTLDAARARWNRLDERRQLFVDLILPKAGEQAEAALLSYESDTGDFTEVMRARIFALDAHLDYEQILSELMKSLAMLRYLIPPQGEWDDYSTEVPSLDANTEQE